MSAPPPTPLPDSPLDPTPDSLQFAVRYDALPLAVYREIAAHLRSIPGVETELEWSTQTTFRYTDSQIEALLIRHDGTVNASRVKQVLDHYGLWQRGRVDPPHE